MLLIHLIFLLLCEALYSHLTTFSPPFPPLNFLFPRPEVIGIPAQSSRTGRVAKTSKVLLQKVEGRTRALVQPHSASGGNAVSKQACGVLPRKRVAGQDEGERDAFSPRKAIRVFKCGPHERNDRVTSFQSLILDLERLGIVELSHVSQVAAYCNSAAFKFWL